MPISLETATPIAALRNIPSMEREDRIIPNRRPASLIGVQTRSAAALSRRVNSTGTGAYPPQGVPENGSIARLTAPNFQARLQARDAQSSQGTQNRVQVEEPSSRAPQGPIQTIQDNPGSAILERESSAHSTDNSDFDPCQGVEERVARTLREDLQTFGDGIRQELDESASVMKGLGEGIGELQGEISIITRRLDHTADAGTVTGLQNQVHQLRAELSVMRGEISTIREQFSSPDVVSELRTLRRDVNTLLEAQRRYQGCTSINEDHYVSVEERFGRVAQRLERIERTIPQSRPGSMLENAVQEPISAQDRDNPNRKSGDEDKATRKTLTATQ